MGWLPDPPKVPGEKPDWLATARLSLPPAPDAASCKGHLGAVLDQERLGSCVWQAIAKLLWSSHVRQGIASPKLCSILAGYYISRAYAGTERYDSGTHLRTGFRALNKFGFCPEDEWPYLIGRFAEMPPTNAFRKAFDQKDPTDYYRIHETGNERLDAIKRAIAVGLPVAFGTDVSRAFCDGELGKVWDHPTGEIAGGHAMVLSGYDGDVFDVLNSWGEGWGDGGWGRMSADYVAWEGTRDLWVAKHAPPYSE
jgi:C1A family cysteine protease